MIQKITSLQNTVVKKTAELKNKKTRNLEGTFFLEGKRAVEEALASGWIMEALFFTEEYEKENLALAETKVPCYLVNRQVMEKIAATEHPQSVGAVLRQKTGSLADLAGQDGLLLVLDGVMDPGNLGTILRTADAAGTLGVVILDNSVDLFNPKVIRSTMGSIFHLPVITGVSEEELQKFCVKDGRRLWATSLEGAEDYHQITWPDRLALIMGNEARGVSETLLRQAGQKIFIPMKGKAESLNVAIAAGILLFAYGETTCQSK